MLLPDPKPSEQRALSSGATTFVDVRAHPYLTESKVVAQTASLAAGVVYTSLLAAIFLPALAILRTRLRALAEVECPGKTEEEQTKWLTQRGLIATLPKQVASALAVLAPLLVGGPGSLLAKLLGGD